MSLRKFIEVYWVDYISLLATIYALRVTSEGKYILAAGHYSVAVLDFKKRERVYTFENIHKSTILRYNITLRLHHVFGNDK